MKTLYALKRFSEDKLLKNNAVKLVMSETTGKQKKPSIWFCSQISLQVF